MYKVWHKPQILSKHYVAFVSTLAEARVLLDNLSKYDEFLFDHDISTEYASQQGISILEDGDWVPYNPADEMFKPF